jgi:hypothetical protein
VLCAARDTANLPLLLVSFRFVHAYEVLDFVSRARSCGTLSHIFKSRFSVRWFRFTAGCAVVALDLVGAGEPKVEWPAHFFTVGKPTNRWQISDLQMLFVHYYWMGRQHLFLTTTGIILHLLAKDLALPFLGYLAAGAIGRFARLIRRIARIHALLPSLSCPTLSSAWRMV